MAGPLYYDRVKETTSTTGTGAYTLAGAVVGFQSFSVVGDGNTCYYAVTDGTGWEVGLGTYAAAGPTLARTNILASSNGGAAVNWTAGSKLIYLDYSAAAASLVPILNGGWGATNVASGRLNFTLPVYVASLAQLKALDTTKDVTSILTVEGRAGLFVWTAGDFSAEVAADTAEGVYIKADAIAATAGAWVRAYVGSVDVRWFGADPTGVADSLAAFTSAVAISLDVLVSPGEYLVSNKVTLSVDGQKVRGAGVKASTVKSSVAAQPIFEIAAALENYEISDLTLDRTVAATSGGHGISCVGYSQLGLLQRLEIRNQWRGLSLGPTSYSHLFQLLIDNCYDDGIYATGTASIGVLQWYMDDILSQRCEGYSYNFETSVGPSSTSMGDWRDVKSYASKLGDVRFKGTVGNPLQGIRWTGGFVGESGNDGVYLDTYNSSPHKIIGVTAELAGIGACGRNNGTPATGIGRGFTITANNLDVNMTGCISLFNSYNGLSSDSTWIVLTGCEARLNGQAAVGGETTGFFIGSGRANIVGCASRGQNFGVYLAADGGHQVSGNDLNDNAIAGVAAGATLGISVVGPNIGSNVVSQGWQTSILTADHALSDVNTAQNLFSAGQDELTVASSITYEFEAQFEIFRSAGTTSHTFGVLFGGTAAILNIDYRAVVSNPTGNVIGAASEIDGAAATLLTLTVANVATTENIRVHLRGVIRVTTGGTIIPQVQYSAAPGGVPSVKRNSFFKARPIGSSAVAIVGNWS